MSSRFFRKFVRSHEVVKVISFPKTGSTWLRVLLGRYFQLLWSLDELVLLEETEAEKAIFAAHQVPAIGVSHGALEWSQQTANDLTYASVVEPYADIPVIVLTRHPLDTLLSLYMQRKYRSATQAGTQIGSLSEFIGDPVMGLDKFIRLHNLWIGKPSLLIVRYEDLRADTAEQILRLLNFVGAPIDNAALSKAVEFASFNNMKSMEQSDKAPHYKSSGFNIFATGDRTNPNAYHVREGRIGGYRDHLTAWETANFVDRITRELSPAYGYARSAEGL